MYSFVKDANKQCNKCIGRYVALHFCAIYLYQDTLNSSVLAPRPVHEEFIRSC